ncbi:MAG: hypothetical protein K9J16_13605 [Melioribacteraceae bacterium]|nr:hypothetical protein [Melioribacteraceae bacterium]MCF8356495.1 hypothetical protein [Melioribacteraceae bacterium]MCF8394852.1 hypothetical protein [Melioribacteraceae bacterium]MCF8420580.1 hypothetical protein [Melioribacteraceae bacterium]
MDNKDEIKSVNKGWSITDGDYKRDYKSTRTYHKQQERKKLITTILKITIYILALILILLLIIE